MKKQFQKKVYVICRNDLKSIFPSYPLVQGGHALAQLILEGKIPHWKNDYLIYITVDNQDELKRTMHKLSKLNIQFSYFLEPDRDFEITSIAVEDSVETKFLSKYPLLLIGADDIIDPYSSRGSAQIPKLKLHHTISHKKLMKKVKKTKSYADNMKNHQFEGSEYKVDRSIRKKK